MSLLRRSRRLRTCALWFALCAVCAQTVVADDRDDSDGSLAAVKARGTLEVALYDAFPPYSYQGAAGPAGIDVDLGRALAKRLGVGFKARLFPADETMSDDLRNNLWKGHYLGGGVADVMIHVAADPKFAAREDKVDFFGAYFNEAVSVVYRPDRMEDFESPLALSTRKVGVEIDSISDYYLSGAFNGRLRTAAVRHGSLREAVEAFRAGQLDALMAPRGELQGLMKAMDLGEVRFRQQELLGLFRTSWDIGLAVRRAQDHSLRQALAGALDELRTEGELEKIFARHGVVYVAPSSARAGAE